MLEANPYKLLNRQMRESAFGYTPGTENYHAGRYKASVRWGCFIPPFSANDEQLKSVLLHHAWRYINGRACPSEVDYTLLMELLAASSGRMKMVGRKHIAAVKRAGSYLAYLTAIAYRSWRLRMTSVQIAKEMGISPTTVRQTLCRLRRDAFALNYDVGRRHLSFGVKRSA